MIPLLSYLLSSTGKQVSHWKIFFLRRAGGRLEAERRLQAQLHWPVLWRSSRPPVQLPVNLCLVTVIFNKILVRTVISTPTFTLQNYFLEQISNLFVIVFGVYSLYIRCSSLSALVWPQWFTDTLWLHKPLPLPCAVTAVVFTEEF